MMKTHVLQVNGHPSGRRSIKMSEAQVAEIVGNIATFGLMLIMFSMGIMLRVRDFINVVKKPAASLLGLVGQILLLPIMAFGICYLMELPAV
jgi:BASS family bile acid:Na+ symporter